MKYVSSVQTLDPRTAVVTCQGEMSILAVEELRQAVDPLLDGSISHLIFDLAEVKYTGSRVLEVLESTYERMRRKRGKVSLVGANSLVRSGLEIFKLDLVVDLYDQIEEVPIGVHPRPIKAKKAWSANVRKAQGDQKGERVRATSLRFADNILRVFMSDGREIGVPLNRVDWLAKATPSQRARWFMEPGGLAVYWEELGDGIEVRHLLAIQPWADGRSLPLEEEGSK